MTSPDVLLVGYYDYRLVALSVLIAMLGSYSTIELGARVTAAYGRNRLPWLIGGAAAMGIGTWSMHYTGMLAFRLPVPVEYDWPTALLSFLASVFSSTVALIVVSRRSMGWFRALAGSVFMGGGIVALHYIAMASMRLSAMCRYSFPLVTLSVVIAIAFSLASLWLTFLFRNHIGQRLKKVASAIMLGAAISAMHYVGMAAASFANSGEVPDLSHAVNISYLDAAGIGIVAVMVLVVALLTSLADRLQKHTILLDELFEQAPQAVVLTDMEGRVSRVNREFTRVFGYTPEEAIGRRLSDLIVPEELQNEYQKLAEEAASGRRVEVETVRRRKDGSRLHLELTRVPVLLPGGQMAIYAIFHDITERKRADEALRKGSEQLRALSASLSSAREEEGTRIARELHDQLGAALTSLKWDLEGISKVCAEPGNLELTDLKDASRLREKIREMMGLIDDTINAVVRISSELRPSVLDDLGLLDAIEWQAEQFAARTGVTCQVDNLVEDVALSRDQATAIFRILQEALTNVLRHAKATRVNITIADESGEFVLEIRDNGRGITEDESASSRSLGLIGMRERALIVKGTIEVTGLQGKGTVLTLRVPVDSRSSD
jgi:PAS domain S-box-containing protein